MTNSELPVQGNRKNVASSDKEPIVDYTTPDGVAKVDVLNHKGL